jgi:hypothetical protein
LQALRNMMPNPDLTHPRETFPFRFLRCISARCLCRRVATS